MTICHFLVLFFIITEIID